MINCGIGKAGFGSNNTNTKVANEVKKMKNKHLSIVGFGKNRAEADFYPTPESTTKALLDREEFEGLIWECASGDGAMAEAIMKYTEANPVMSSDIREDVYGRGGVNFLKSNEKAENIITNPPYRYAKEFVLKAKEQASQKVAMLLKLVFLESSGRYEMFRDKAFPLKKVYVFCKRQKIYAKGIIGKNSGLIAYAWFVWDKNYKGKPTIEWIPE